MGFEEEYLKQFNTNLTIFKTDNSININIDNEEEKSLIENITKKTINTIKKSKVKKINSNVEIKTTRKSKTNIKKHIDLYINYLTLTNKNKKTIDSYIKKFEVLIDYFNYKNILSLEDVNKKICKDLELYLLNFPSNLNKYEELKNKNIFELIDKKDKILNKYKKLDKRTIDSYFTRYKTLFNFFLDNDYIYQNYFLTIKKMSDNSNNSFKNFIDKQDTYNTFEIEEIEELLTKITDKEIKTSIIISLLLGLRISEIFNLKKEDIKKIKDNYFINITKSKTKNGIRTIPLKNTFNFVIEELLLNSKNNEFLLFKEEKEENRDNILQKRIMYNIRKYIKEKNKVFHSFRKNYTQILYKNNVEELYIKIFLGHSLKDNLSFNTYNLSKIDNNLLSDVIQKVNFEELFLNLDFFKEEINKQNEEKNKKNKDFGLFL
ncbi:tyrosine-type recombinase/integrase [Aliarcobacter cryaerophilus]|uniref:site-specific integrase n=1 Tax=Aliarcobacter cryaerophilus TaxID=28198 RepID=UPI0021B334A2|nr:site-specific integrase [Aliarcobacter cryaerophilus]MCT7494014.1 tyrosine-type recombinase/integrase [Aliarcobacter cryaerophilus]